MPNPEIHDPAWSQYRAQWRIRPGTTYLNHGSFGPPPVPVREQQQLWKARMDDQPMDFFVREHAPALRDARQKLSQFIGAAPEDVVFVENATYGMNVVAASFKLSPDDEVLLTDHEYGAVERIWRRRCEQTGANVRVVDIPRPIQSADEVADSIFRAASPRTRLLVVSHITSPTAVILPVNRLCGEARNRGIATCIDGPHAPAQVPVNLSELNCDFYTASCHKWLSAPFGTGFLFVASRHQESITTPQLSWGLLRPERPQRWDEEFIWTGTRDASAYLTVPKAIEFLEQLGLEHFRTRTHALARYARENLARFAPRSPIVPDSNEWYGSMCHMPLPPVDATRLQRALWEEYQIEVPIVDWSGSQWIRVSCHLYNTPDEIDFLVKALDRLLNSR